MSPREEFDGELRRLADRVGLGGRHGDERGPVAPEEPLDGAGPSDELGLEGDEQIEEGGDVLQSLPSGALDF